MYDEKEVNINFSEYIQLESGLRAYRVPQMLKWGRTTSGRGAMRCPTVNEAEENLNLMLKEIERKGGELKGVISMSAINNADDVDSYTHPHQQSFLIVEKK
ncbi:hypothetical protein [Dictyobacter formicarum]|uniref:Uncharacterized protein n=1 Tax=Dictyobacter formicarum TaxID=2778368 RepID=A0ABQ3VGP3_9CHLR|nr:hypothetical protein [Dictyobacter formicarum]GHO85195.1 hypothetical protein KSZ_32010 [Dictyobacter formicarum]